jgi:arylsulfatase A-like enzyme
MNNSICLVVDRLQAAYLGCYGNAWIATPSFNRLAAEGFVFDQALIDSPNLEDLYRAYWRGTHALQPTGERGNEPLPRLLAKSGVATTLLTDEPDVRLPEGLGDRFEHIQLPVAEHVETAAEAESTQLAGFFAAAIEWLETAQGPFCLWLHTRGLGAPWDAPLEFRNQYADEEESPPPASVEVPRLLLPPEYDPDQLLGFCQAYAGQVSLLDECLGGLLTFLDESGLAKTTLLSVLGARGFALGEHRRVGGWDDVLHAELVHVPWLLRFPDRTGAASRSQALVQPADLHETLLDWYQLATPSPCEGFAHSLLPIVRDEREAVRDRAISTSESGERGVRTTGWYLRTSSGEPLSGETSNDGKFLYAKPDDRIEINDVASRCGDVVEQMVRVGAEFAERAASLAPPTFSPLDESLVTDQH